jgi:hypothetical protein
MKTQTTSASVIRAGVISLLVFALCYLWITGISDLPRAWLFIVSFAVCLVLMMQSVVDLLTLGSGFVARVTGTKVGGAVRIVRRLFSHAPNAA